jgi:hypothetical protein
MGRASALAASVPVRKSVARVLFGRRRSGRLGDLRSVAAERSPEEPVDHLIEEEGADLVAAPDEFVADAHEVFDERGDFFERS